MVELARCRPGFRAAEPLIAGHRRASEVRTGGLQRRVTFRLEGRGVLTGVEIRRVRFRQSGGFAGLVRGSEVAGDQLGAPDRRALERHLTSTRAATPADSSRARDLVVYELEVDTDSGHVRIEFDEASVPDDLAALVEHLASRARPMAP